MDFGKILGNDTPKEVSDILMSPAVAENPVAQEDGTVSVKSHNDIPKETIEKSEQSSEVKVGMLHYAKNLKRFSGIIKQRFSDFMVRECDPDGNLVYLTSLDHCDIDLDKDTSQDDKPCPMTDTDLERVKEFIRSEDKEKTLLLQSDSDKERRGRIHKYLKDTFKQLDTTTITAEDESKSIKVFFKSSKGQKQPARNQINWPSNLPEYCHFTLFKQNKDTMEAINHIARALHIKPSSFSYAGTKDRRATTMQRVAVHKILSKRLSNLKLYNMGIGDFCYKPKQISLGDLSGNQFTLVIRDVKVPHSEVQCCMDSITKNGFINYFGLQRFGTGAVPTHIIGKSLLQNEWEQAVRKILQPHDQDREDAKRAKECWLDSGDPEKALEMYRGFGPPSIEYKLLEGLIRHGRTNYLNAMKCIPRNMRMMYLHSYQSYVWNLAVSKRVEMFGLEPSVGDFVLDTSSGDGDGYEKVVALNEDDISSCKYTIFDIVLPLPGYDMQYPENLTSFYKDQLERDGLDINSMRQSIKEFSLSGKYRHIMVKPKDLKWELIPYHDYKVPLIENDMDKITKMDTDSNDLHDNKGQSTDKLADIESNGVDSEQKAMASHVQVEGTCSNSDVSVSNVVQEPPTYLALRLQFTLPTSCYATSALREVLIDDSSYTTQQRLNQEFLDKSQPGQKRSMDEGNGHNEDDNIKKGHFERGFHERGRGRGRGRGKHNGHSHGRDNRNKHRGGNRHRGRGGRGKSENRDSRHGIDCMKGRGGDCGFSCL